MLALFVGIYLIVTTSIIAKDGVTFIQYAQSLEAAPIQTMVMEFQHPGYPWLIYLVHKSTAFIHKNSSVMGWIYSAQAVALTFRILAIILLYFIGKRLTGSRSSYLAVLIFILLPVPAEFGSDALSDWPHLFFFFMGLLLLLVASKSHKWWVYSLAGLSAGAGYLVRPECAQIIILGGLWLTLQLFSPNRSMSKTKVLLALTVLIIGFSVFAAPYMKLKGSLLPKKSLGIFFADSTITNGPLMQDLSEETINLCSIKEFKAVKGFFKLIQNIGEMTMWFFVPALFIGVYKFLKKHPRCSVESFFVTALIIMNISILVWLYCEYGYISNRHTLPLLAITILFVSEGLELLAHFINKNFAKKGAFNQLTANNRLFFTILLIAGITICLPKLLRPIRIDKRGYREAAEWLKANTKSQDIIAVPDKRISFYAERQIRVYKAGKLPRNAEYIVIISKNRKDNPILIKMSGKLKYEYIDKKGRNDNIIVIYEL